MATPRPNETLIHFIGGHSNGREVLVAGDAQFFHVPTWDGLTWTETDYGVRPVYGEEVYHRVGDLALCVEDPPNVHRLPIQYEVNEDRIRE